MNDKIRVGILCGGQSAEHEVSLRSAKQIIQALDQQKYDPILIGIDKQGRWLKQNIPEFLEVVKTNKCIEFSQTSQLLSLQDPNHRNSNSDLSSHVREKIDVVFPMVHGVNGEDGTLQGLLTLRNLPYVGSEVMGSAICMDKDVSKRLLRDAGIPVANFMTLKAQDINASTLEEIIATLGLPCFVKPVNTGSSIGVTKAKTLEELNRAIELAFEYDTRIIVEAMVHGREIECAVLGNDAPKASLPGEVITSYEFYSYEAKYWDDKLVLDAPAKLPESLVTEIQAMAIRAFKILCCYGMARVDFFLTADNALYINELNTIPGFTQASFYPRLWEQSGLAYSQLLDELISLALERHHQRQRLRIDYY